MTFLNPLEALIPKIPFSFFSDFWVWVTSEAQGSVSVAFWGSCQLSLLGGGVRPEGSIDPPPPPPKRKPGLPWTCGGNVLLGRCIWNGSRAHVFMAWNGVEKRWNLHWYLRGAYGGTQGDEVVGVVHRLGGGIPQACSGVLGGGDIEGRHRGTYSGMD